MNLTYNQKNSYNVFCDTSGSLLSCSQTTTTDIYGDGVYISTTSQTVNIRLEQMKKIVNSLK